MKVITLLPVKNEEWILDFSLSNFSLFSDEIIILDDRSTDNSKKIALKYPKVKIIDYKKEEKYVDMSVRRSVLLEEGRKSGGTHFVMLDADETLSSIFLENFNEKISILSPGETLLSPWIFVESNLSFEKNQKKNFKDFIFCDDKVSKYIKRILSEDRTPGDKNKFKYLEFDRGYVLHFQNFAIKRNTYKQAWYRCNELLEGKKSPRRINAIYSWRSELKNKEILADDFTMQNLNKIDKNAKIDFYLNNIKEMFEKHGIEFFEPLDIWRLDELKVQFTKKTGRLPIVKKYPGWIICINNFKNKIKNYIK